MLETMLNPAGFDEDHADTISRELADFARRQLVNATLYAGDERRREERRSIIAPALVVGVDEENRPLEEPFEAITRDVTSSSISLYHADETPHERFAIHMTLADTEIDLVVTAKWKGPMGPYYGLAGVYVAKLDRFPTQLR